MQSQTVIIASLFGGAAVMVLRHLRCSIKKLLDSTPSGRHPASRIHLLYHCHNPNAAVSQKDKHREAQRLLVLLVFAFSLARIQRRAYAGVIVLETGQRYSTSQTVGSYRIRLFYSHAIHGVNTKLSMLSHSYRRP